MAKTEPGIPYDPQEGNAPDERYRLNVVPRLDPRDKVDPDETKLQAAKKQPALAMIEKRPDRLDQLPLGSCTANGTVHMNRIKRMNAGLSVDMLSRLQLYYDERAIEGDIPDDAGADPRDGLKSFQKRGVGLESLWPYDITRFAERPPDAVYADAPNHRIKAYYRVVSLRNLKDKLIANDPVGLAMLVFNGMERSRNGVIPMPAPGEQPLGGHWLTITGYCDRPDWPGGGYVRLDNSWGPTAGDGTGCYYLPYAYLLNAQLCPVMWRMVL